MGEGVHTHTHTHTAAHWQKYTRTRWGTSGGRTPDVPHSVIKTIRRRSFIKWGTRIFRCLHTELWKFSIYTSPTRWQPTCGGASAVCWDRQVMCEQARWRVLCISIPHIRVIQRLIKYHFDSWTNKERNENHFNNTCHHFLYSWMFAYVWQYETDPCVKKPVHIGKHDIFVPFIFPLHIGITQQLEETLFMNSGGGCVECCICWTTRESIPDSIFCCHVYGVEYGGICLRGKSEKEINKRQCLCKFLSTIKSFGSFIKNKQRFYKQIKKFNARLRSFSQTPQFLFIHKDTIHFK